MVMGDGVKIGLDVSFNNTYDCKGIQEKTGEINCTEAYITHDEIPLKPRRFLLIKVILTVLLCMWVFIYMHICKYK
jgi:hypothetical protein